MNLVGRLSSWAEKDSDAAAVLAPSRPELSRSALRSHLLQTIHDLRSMSITRQHRVAIVLPPGPEIATATLAVMATATAVPINPEAKKPEVADAFHSLRPELLITSRQASDAARDVARELRIPVREITWTPADPAGVFHFQSSCKAAQPGESFDTARPDDIALILSTSGTTSNAKLVPLSHRNLLVAAEALIESLELTEADRCLNLMPQFHIGGLWDTVAGSLLSGGSVVCGGTFSSASFYSGLTEFRPTWTQAVPVMVREVLDAWPSDPDSAPPRLRFIRSVSAPLSRELRDECERQFTTPVIEIYGMTETAGVITSNPLPPRPRPAGSVGVVVGPSVAIVDSAGDALPVGSIGEVVVQGESVTAGYLGAPDANAAAFDSSGFHTGDLGHFDSQGNLYLTGRVKDLINRGGEKISPAEIDEAMLRQRWVRDAACFAVPHPTLGEEVAAAVVLEPNAPEDAKSVTLAALRDQLTFFKVPRHLVVVDTIPRSKGGKLQRRLLTEQFQGAGQVAGVQASGCQDRLKPGLQPAAECGSPDTVVSSLVATLWEEVLDVERVGLHDDFFSLGGSSLKAAFFVNRLQQRFAGQIVYVSSVYDAPTPAQYEAFLREHNPEVAAALLGELVMSSAGREARVTPELQASFRGAITPTLSEETAPERHSNPSAAFILSPPRSGSTLLRAMLAGNPQLFAPPELYLLSYETLAARRNWFRHGHDSQLEGAVRAMMQATGEPSESCAARIQRLESDGCRVAEFYRLLQSSIGGRLLVDKTPLYGVDGQVLQRAEAYFDRPRYVHLTRHPYGVIRSFEEARLAQLWWPRLVGPDAEDERCACPFAPRQLAEMIWALIHQNIVEFLTDVDPERQLAVQFEQLVADPDEQMHRVCEFLRVPFDAAMLDPLSDPRSRMTDGVQSAGRMIGDPKFHSHRGIDREAADLWKSSFDHDFLAEATWHLANSLGYHETVEAVSGRVTIEI